MIPASGLSGETKRQVIELDCGTVFIVQYRHRCSAQFGPDARNGVYSEELVSVYSSALKHCYCQITGTTFGWKPASTNRAVRTDVVIRDLGPILCGVANPNWCRAMNRPRNANIALTCRPHANSSDAVVQECFATVAHELVHLLQFDTTTWQFWPKQGRIGYAHWARRNDPNNWLHEATAFALEAILCEKDVVDWHRLLWDWATRPELGMDSDPYGLLAAPFIVYLTRKFDPRIVADLYQVTDAEVPSMLGADLIAHCVARRSRSSPVESLNSIFVKYCVDVALPDQSGFDSSIERLVGPRAVTEIYGDYPVKQNTTYVIESLGCRYFHFARPKNNDPLKIVVSEASGRAETLRARLISVSPDEPNTEGEAFSHDSVTGHLELKTNALSKGSCEYGFLVVANWLHEAGAARSRAAEISVSVDVS